VWVDRLRRKPIMIGADLLRALLLVSIPIAFLGGSLRIEQLYVVAALVGGLSIVFDVAYRSYLPSLIARDQLVEGNSKLGASESVAEVGGSALAGALVQIFGAPLTILVDAVTFLFSALSLGLIRKPEPRPLSPAGYPSLRREILEGLKALLGQAVLRALAGGAATLAFFGGFFGALYVLYAVGELGIAPAVLGLLIASGGIGSLLGAFFAGPLVKRFGLGKTLVWSLALTGALHLFIPLAGGPVWLAAAFLFVGQLAGDMARTVFSIHELSLRQAIAPDRLLGRANAGMEFVQGGVGTAGLLVGGFLGEAIGLRPAVWVAALGTMLACLWLIFSPVREMEALSAE
jgi:predicted MFS family arabinose efflux permease